MVSPRLLCTEVARKQKKTARCIREKKKKKAVTGQTAIRNRNMLHFKEYFRKDNR